MGKKEKMRGRSIRERHFDKNTVTRKEYKFTFKQKLQFLFGANLVVYTPALKEGRLISIEIEIVKPKKEKGKK